MPSSAGRANSPEDLQQKVPFPGQKVFVTGCKIADCVNKKRFTSTATAVEEITALQEGKLGKGLKQFLSDEIVEKGKGKETLLVADPKLGALPVAFFGGTIFS